MSLENITDAITNPSTAVPVATAGTVVNALVDLPFIVSAGWLVYLALLIGHKIWTIYKEWRSERTPRGIGNE